LAGEIRIGDRNYARAPVLKRFLAAGGGMADFIVRVGCNALQLSTSRGKPFDLIAYLQRLPAGMKPHEVILRAAAGAGEVALGLRLIVQRKTPEATEAAQPARPPLPRSAQPHLRQAKLHERVIGPGRRGAILREQRQGPRVSGVLVEHFNGFRQAAACDGLISPRYTTWRCTTRPLPRRWFTTTLQ
jgi:hypothetical protein